MLLDELVDRHEATTDSYDEIVVLHLHDDLLGEVAVCPTTLTIAPTHKEALHALLRVALIDKVGQFGVDQVVFLRNVLEVHLVEFSPVSNHFIKLSVTVTEGLHLFYVCEKLGSVLVELLLHGLEVFDVTLVLLVQLLKLQFVVLVHPVVALELAQARRQLKLVLFDG